jgi:competence protein CoiA
MKFALVGGERREAEPGLSAECPVCRAAMIPKSGDVRVPHWAHRRTSDCDHWWEPETEWHRASKNHFPKDWQEIVHTSESGEKHIADVKTESGMVIEFQYSFLNPDERVSRENFYPKLVWVVNGQRRKRDRKQFFASLGSPLSISPVVPIYSVPMNESALLRDWGASRVPVYFDFGTDKTEETLRFDTDALWRLNPRTRHGSAYLVRVPRTQFVRIHLKGEPFEESCAELVELVDNYFREQARQPLVAFERYSARRRRRF